MFFQHFHHLVVLALATSLAEATDVPAVHGPPKGSNPLTWGLYATPEIQEPVKLKMVGSFPKWLTGSLYRGAAGTWDTGNYTSEHWFDGFSRNHRFEIANGEVSYRSRNGSDEIKDFIEETGMYPGPNFGGDPCKIIFGAFEMNYRDGNVKVGNVSTDIISVAYIPDWPGLRKNTSSDVSKAPFKTLVSTTDTNKLQQIDPVTLEPIELFTYQAHNPELNNGLTSAAHPGHDHEEGFIYNYVLDTHVEPPEYRVFGVDPATGRAHVLATIDDAPAAYIHSVFNTANYVILVVWQADIVRPGSTLMSMLGPWDSERKTLFYVIDRHNGGVRAKYEAADPFFAFHRINSFETKRGDIILDIPTMVDNSFLDAAKMENLRANIGKRSEGKAKHDLPGTFTRFRLPYLGRSATKPDGSLKTAKALKIFSMPWKGANIELPRISPFKQAQPYRYAWGIHVEKPGYFADSIVKLDIEKQKAKVWEPKLNGLPSEPVFIPSPDAKEEDGGVLLTVVMDSGRKKSALVAIDAQTMEEVGQAQMPVVMGYGFHGYWGEHM